MTSSTEPPSRQAILELLEAQDAPTSPEEVAIRLKVGPEAIVALRRRLAAMQRDGQILQNRKGGLMPVGRIDLVAGRVTGHRDGFGFMVPDDGSGDIFLPPREMQKVMHGDRVLVRRSGTDSRGRTEGSIVEVTARPTRTLVGRLVNERGVMLVVPEDQRIKHDVMIQPGGAMGASAGQVVSVEIVEPPTQYTPPIGRVVEILGEVDDPGMEIEIAVRKFDVPHRFSEELLRAVSTLPDVLQPADYRNRVDLRDVPLVTIDGEDARDFDDAVYCEPLDRDKPSAGWRLLVAIADVSHYVTLGSLLDEEAQARSTSVYFPRRVIPMLPEKLSNGLCSLNPGVDRLVLVADMVVDGRGRTKAYQFYPGVIHSAARLTYDEVWGILSGRNPLAIQARGALVGHLNDLHQLYRTLSKARQARGAVDFETVETKIICDPAGRIQSIVAQERNDAHRLIEECMLCANTCAADFLVRMKHPGLYRVHEGPTPDRLANLRQYLSTLGLHLGERGKDPTPQDYQVLARAIADRPDAALLQTMMLRSMQQAIYTPFNSGHFGLAYDAYAHYTSPIRRYPDLLNHRAIKALLSGGRYLPDVLVEGVAVPASATAREDAGKGREDAAAAKAGAPAHPQRPHGKEAAGAAGLAVWEALGVLCSVNERRADDATRDVEAWLKCQYMKERVGEQYRGRITGVAPFGIFVTLENLFVEGMVHVSDLGAEYFQYSETSHELRGERTGKRYRLTDEIDVQVSRVDLEGRRIDFRLVQDARPRSADDGRPDARPAEAHAGGDDSANAKSPRGHKAGKAGKGGKGGRKAAPAKSQSVREAREARKAGKADSRGRARRGR